MLIRILTFFWLLVQPQIMQTSNFKIAIQAAALVAADSVGRDTPKDLLPAMQAQLERAKLAVESGAASEILDLWGAAGADMR